MGFQARDAYSSLGHTRLVYKTQRLSAREKEKLYIKSNATFLGLEKIFSQCDENRAYSPTKLQDF
jgi:hypothetical protein